VGVVLRSSGRAGRSWLLAVACLIVLVGIPGPATRAYGVGRAVIALGSSLPPRSSLGPGATASEEVPASKTPGPREGSGSTGPKPVPAGRTSGRTNRLHGRKLHARPADGRSPLARGPWLPLLLIAVFLLTIRRLARLS
jgi:hypothetical protein